MTVIELKSVIFCARQAFSQSVPVEEQLRIFSEKSLGEPLSATEQAQLEIHLKQLITRRAEIKQHAASNK